jgi:hypothetical protein
MLGIVERVLVGESYGLGLFLKFKVGDAGNWELFMYGGVEWRGQLFGGTDLSCHTITPTMRWTVKVLTFGDPVTGNDINCQRGSRLGIYTVEQWPQLQAHGHVVPLESPDSEGRRRPEAVKHSAVY